jgi:regulatory protein
VTRPTAPDDPESAKAAAVALLARRDWSPAELAARLARKGFGGDAIAAALEALTAARLLDESRYAEAWVRTHAARGQGPLRLRQGLRAAGLDDAAIEAALEGATDFHALAAAVRQRKFGTAVPRDFAGKAKQARFLQYRGFSADHIRSALGDVPGDAIDPDP